MSKTVRKLKDQMNMLQRWEVMRRFGRRFTLAADSFRPVFENIYLGKKRACGCYDYAHFACDKRLSPNE